MCCTSNFKKLFGKKNDGKIQRSAIPGIGIEVLTLDPVLVLVLGIDLGLLAVLVLVLGIELRILWVLVLVLGIDHGILAVLILVKGFVKNFNTCQGQINWKNQAKMWLFFLKCSSYYSYLKKCDYF